MVSNSALTGVITDVLRLSVITTYVDKGINIGESAFKSSYIILYIFNGIQNWFEAIFYFQSPLPAVLMITYNIYHCD